MSELQRYIVVTRPHSLRCYEPHCGEARATVWDRVSGNEVTAFHDMAEASEMADHLSREWDEYKKDRVTNYG